MPSARRRGVGDGGDGGREPQRGPPPPYTAILPVREGRGTGHLDESVGSLLRLDPAPSEVLFGVDEGSSEELAGRLSSICDSHSYTGRRIVAVPRSKRFAFQLGHVVWKCILAAEHDRILVSNADTSVLQPTMRGLREVGPGGAAFVSLTERWPVDTPARLVRYATYRRRIAMAPEAPYTGQFWSYRPAVLDVLGEEDIARTRDGIDDLVYHALRRSGMHTVLTHKEAGSYVHGDTHYTIPWVQFKAGLHLGARAQARLSDLRCGSSEAGGYRRFMSLPRPLRVPAARAAYAAVAAWDSLSTWTPHRWKGYRWAMRNPGHPAVRAAASMGPSEWVQAGAEHLGGVPVPGRGGGEGAGGVGWD